MPTAIFTHVQVEWSVYEYRPSLVANGEFIALFGLGGVIHTCLGFRWKTWWFMSCMIVSSVNACIGYAARSWSWGEPFSFRPFRIQMICITTCPAYYSAAVYVTLGQT
ncbi:hypothetical protein F5X99DRAFT_414694 [Biscogniauxia marginata]|nr:hypothetical protein F5X99DRAFT_414694 [Biscogniauxia marginata]